MTVLAEAPPRLMRLVQPQRRPEPLAIPAMDTGPSLHPSVEGLFPSRGPQREKAVSRPAVVGTTIYESAQAPDSNKSLTLMLDAALLDAPAPILSGLKKDILSVAKRAAFYLPSEANERATKFDRQREEFLNKAKSGSEPLSPYEQLVAESDPILQGPVAEVTQRNIFEPVNEARQNKIRTQIAKREMWKKAATSIENQPDLALTDTQIKELLRLSGELATIVVDDVIERKIITRDLLRKERSALQNTDEV